MRKFIVFLLLLVLVGLPAIASCESRIADYADLFTPDEEAELLSMISEFQIDTALDFVILTTSEPHPDFESTEYAAKFYDENDYGMGTDNGGILYYIDMNERVPSLVTTGRMIMHMSDSRIDAAHAVCHSSLAAGNYALAAAQMMAVVKAFVYD